MADGLNEARALRITEVMNDFQNLQRRISEYAPNPPPEEYYEQGYEVLRQCRAEAQAVLMAPYPPDTLQVPGGPEEQEKRQLQRIVSELQQADSHAGYWLQEDPPLPTMLNWIRSLG
ncbi:MAG: hypothetical protein Q9214_001270 [Letrouitia sp. 1 TL-2023]